MSYNDGPQFPQVPAKKRRIWPWVVAALVLVFCGGGTLIAMAVGSAATKAVQTIEASATALPTKIKTVTPTTKPAPTTTRPSTPPEPQGVVQSIKPVSVEQQNANAAAVSYLDGQSFSRSGLIDQLEYEGYSSKASTIAVDALHVDWNEQAVLVAKRYLDGQAFSKKSLIEQLKYEGFSTSQAKYGVSKTGL